MSKRDFLSVDDVEAAELVDGDLEGDPGAGRGLLEDQRDRAAAKGAADAPVGLVAVGPVQQGDQLAGVDVVDREEVTFAHGRSLRRRRWPAT